MKILGLLKTLTAVALTMAAGAATASTLIDFNSATSNNVASLTFGAVTFTANGGGTVFTNGYGNTPNGTVGIIALSGAAFVPTRATFAGGSSSVSVDIGDYDGDDDSLFLRLYDSSDVLLATATNFIPASFTGLVTLSASAAGTAYAVFGGVGFNNESNVYGDNFTYSGSAVPEPATWALMIGGLAACGGALRRRRAVATA